MTEREIYDKILTDFGVAGKLVGLYYGNRNDEAVTYIKDYFKCDVDTAEKVYEIFKEWMGPGLPPEIRARNNAMAREALNKPKCPTCSSTNVKKISDLSKFVDTVVFDIYGTKRYKTFYCNNCGYEW